MELPQIINENIESLNQICRQFGVEKLFAFGSVTTENFDVNRSDLDFLVNLNQMPALEGGENLISLWEALESLFSLKVDLLTDQPIKNPYLLANIERTKLLVYDRESEKVLIPNSA